MIVEGLIVFREGKSSLLPKDWKQPMGSDRKLSCLHFLRWRRGCIWSIIWTVRLLFLSGGMCVEILYVFIYLFLPHLDRAPIAYYAIYPAGWLHAEQSALTVSSSQRVWAPAICWDVASHSWNERML